jgi:hypothetical protein
MIMAIIFARMLVCLLCGLVAFAGGLVLVGIGDTKRAMSLLLGCAVIAWMAYPNVEERAAFDEFQKQRLAKHGIEL